MFTSQSDYNASSAAGFTGKVDDVNMYQAAGALAVVGTVAGATMTMAYVAPLPTLGGLAAGGGLLYTGHRIKTGKAKSLESKDEQPQVLESDAQAVPATT